MTEDRENKSGNTKMSFGIFSGLAGARNSRLLTDLDSDFRSTVLQVQGNLSLGRISEEYKLNGLRVKILATEGFGSRVSANMFNPEPQATCLRP